MTKYIYSLLMGLSIIIVACSDDNQTQTEETLELDLASNQFENSSTGIYNGVFTTNDGEERGAIQVTIPSNETMLPSAQLMVASGEESVLTASQTILPNQAINNIFFESNQTSFYFSVEGDGGSPEISNVILNNKEGDILIRKHSNSAPVLPITGTYICEECGTHPTLNNTTTQTFNILREGSAQGSPAQYILETQVTLGNNIFNGTGNEQEITMPDFVTAPMQGEITVNGPNVIEWSGNHSFINNSAIPNDCSEVLGEWVFDSPSFGILSGTITSDIDCFSPGQLIGLTNNTWKLNGFSEAPSSEAIYHDDVMDEVNGDINAWSHDAYFYDANGYAYFKCYRGTDTSSGSGNPRVELRELDGNGNNGFWDGDNGSHVMEFTVRVEELPNGYNQNTNQERTTGTVCFAQIHGPSANDDGVDVDDTIRLQFEGDRGQTSGDVNLKISGYITEEQGGGSESFSGYELNKDYEVALHFTNGVITVYIDNNLVFTRDMDTAGDESYFKAGNYLQSVQNGSFDGSFGIVGIKSLTVNHSN